MVLVVAAVGRSGSGKTVTLEYLVKCFSSEGYRVGVVKHVHHRGFTVDTEGKNTWRYAQAGAKVIAAVSPGEVAIIKKIGLETEVEVDQILEGLQGEGLDVVFIEGYYGLIAKRVDVLKILTVKDEGFLEDMLVEGVVEPVLAVSGLIAKNYVGSSIGEYPLVRIPEEGQILVDLIKQQLKCAKKAGASKCE